MMFWLRQSALMVVIYLLLSYINHSFFSIRIDQSFIVFQFFTIVSILGISVFVFGKKTLKALFELSFVDLNQSFANKDFIVDCAKMYYTKGALSLEKKLSETKDAFVHKAIHLLVDQVSINQFNQELALELNYLDKKLKRAKSMVKFICINVLSINFLYLLSIIAFQDNIQSAIIECVSFLIIVLIGILLPFYYLIDQYQNRKLMSYEIYKLGFSSILNQMSSRQIEIAISMDVDI